MVRRIINGRRAKRRRVSFQPAVQTLEDRALWSVSAIMSGSALVVTGPSTPDDVTIRLAPGDTTRIEILDGGALTSFAVSDVARIEASLGGGDDVLHIDATNSNPIPAGGLTYAGGIGRNALFGPDAASGWDITGTNAGTGSGVTFTGVWDLVGGSGADTFRFTPGARLLGRVEGGLGSDTLNYSDCTAPVVVKLATGAATGLNGTGAGGFTGIEAAIGGTARDILWGPAGDATWAITGANRGSVAGFSFESFETMAGNAGADRFQFAPGATLSGAVNGGAGADTFDYGACAATVVVNVASRAASGVYHGSPGGILSVEAAVGGAGRDILFGPAGDTTWAVTGANRGTVAGFSFESFETLGGNSGADTFKFASTAMLGGAINGGAGLDTFDFAARSTPVAVDLQYRKATSLLDGRHGAFMSMERLVGGQAVDEVRGLNVPTTWTIGSAAIDINGTFTTQAVESLRGGVASDRFEFGDGSLAVGAIDGGLGNDTLDYGSCTTAVVVNLGTQAGTTVGALAGIEEMQGGAGRDVLFGPAGDVNWSVNAADAGVVAGLTFRSFETLAGNAGADTFQFAASATLGGAVNGGEGVDTLDFSARTAAVQVNLQSRSATPLLAGQSGAFMFIEQFIGGASGQDRLVGSNAVTTWAVTGPDVVGMTGDLTCRGFEQLVGGNSDDTFRIDRGASLSSQVDGGSGTDGLVYGQGFNRAVTLDLVKGSTSYVFNGAAGGITGLERVEVPFADSNTVRGAGDFFLDHDLRGSANGVAFAGFWNVVGSDGNDTFRFAAFNENLPMLNAGAGDDRFELSDHLAAFGYPDGGPGTDTLVGSPGGAMYFVGGQVNVDGVFSFNSIENVQGGSAADRFDVAYGVLPGWLHASPAGGKLDYTWNGSGITVNLATGTATGIMGGIQNFNAVIGGPGDDHLTGNDAANVLAGDGLDIGVGGGNDTIVGGGGNDVLIGGERADAIDGGAGDDVIVSGRVALNYYDGTMNAVLAEWARVDADYPTRINHLLGTQIGGLNGTNYLRGAPNQTVWDDAAVDTLTGGGGRDWFFQSAGDAISDRDTGPETAETITSV